MEERDSEAEVRSQRLEVRIRGKGMSDLTIVNALVVPMTEERQSFNGFVRVSDGVITEVRAGAPREVTKDAPMIDADGAVLMPGLVNAHTHLYQVLLRAVWEDLPLLLWLKRIYGAAQVLRPEHFYAGTLLGCIEAIRISAHVAESRSVVEFTKEKHGKSGVVGFLDDFGIPAPNSIFAHCVHVSDDEIRVLKERGASVSHNPVSNMMLGDGVAPVVEMIRGGVNVALG